MKPALLIGTFLVLIVAGKSYSQTAKDRFDKLFTETTPEQSADLQSRMMEAKLHLKEDQKPTVDEINLTYAQKMQHIYNNGGRDFHLYKHMRTLSKDRDKEIRKVLTGDQYKFYVNMYKDQVTELIRKYVEELKQEEVQAEQSEKVYSTFLAMKYSQ